MDRSEQTKKNQAINLYTWGLELLSDGGHVRDAEKVGWMLGMLYLMGRGVTRNYAKARHYFEQALQGGELNVEAAVAQYWLGQMYKEGIGVPKDREKGETLIRLAAINGYAPHGTPREIRQQMGEKE